jgi:hypothetical protein
MRAAKSYERLGVKDFLLRGEQLLVVKLRRIRPDFRR